MKRDVFHAVADPTRRSILALLSRKPMTPNAIASHFDVSRQAISKHIRILDECRMLKHEQNGREIVYQFNTAKLKEIDKWLHPFREQWDKRFSQLDAVLTTMKNKKP